MVADALQHAEQFEVARFAGLTIQNEYNLEVPITVAREARGNVAQPFALSLSAGDTGLDPLDQAAAFLLDNGRTGIGNEPPYPVGTNFVDPAVGNRDRRTCRFASLKEPLVDATQASEPRDLPDDVVVLTTFDRLNEVGGLLATGVSSGLREVDVPIGLCGINVALGELGVYLLALVGGLLSVGQGANVAGVAGRSRVVFVASSQII